MDVLAKDARSWKGQARQDGQVYPSVLNRLHRFLLPSTPTLQCGGFHVGLTMQGEAGTRSVLFLTVLFLIMLFDALCCSLTHI